MFENRADAGRRLAAALIGYESERPCILALPRGGVPVAFEVAKRLEAPLDVVLVRKIGAPFEPELAVGAVVDGEHPEIVLNHPIAEGSSLKRYVDREVADQLAEIERRRKLYVGSRPRLDVRGRTVIVVDDGIATGATMRAALHATRRAQPQRVILAVPVAPKSTLAELNREADEIVCLQAEDELGAIGEFYVDFAQVSDGEVRDLLAHAATLPTRGAAPIPSSPESPSSSLR